ncbi:hypothetical protein EV141_1582 [Microcella putealis]|uniref:Uncharacterized protein n=1 Tax=Microcella putealis TaxID=337005 RepID=A0A4V2EWI7_9MICO|nr:hypothetical protein EV141_1582 [Microcella putealis]TQM23439.1 hypothetical protein BJ957_1802 [Microcella putealis]
MVSDSVVEAVPKRQKLIPLGVGVALIAGLAALGSTRLPIALVDPTPPQPDYVILTAVCVVGTLLVGGVSVVTALRSRGRNQSVRGVVVAVLIALLSATVAIAASMP